MAEYPSRRRRPDDPASHSRAGLVQDPIARPAAAMPATPPPPPPAYPPVSDSVPSRRSRRATARRAPRFDAITAIGELLMTAGAIIGLFAFWQTYVTDWQVASATTQQIDQFNSTVEAAPNRIATDERTDEPPALPPTPYGQIIGTLHVPKWNYMVVPVREGVGSDVLDTGAAGHYPSTAPAGSIGNFSIAAHRRSYGSNFRRIDTLADGDTVVLELKDAWLVYRFQSREIVSPEQSDVILPVPRQPGVAPTERLFTMTTCHPEYGNWERFIVHLQFDHWVPRSAGIPKEIAEGR